MKIKAKFEGESSIALLEFIEETKQGKYTNQKPDLTQITYKRLEIPEQEMVPSDASEEPLLFGFTW